MSQDVTSEEEKKHGNLTNGTTRCRPKPSCRKHQTQREAECTCNPRCAKAIQPQMTAWFLFAIILKNANLQSLTHPPKHNPSKIAEIDQKPSKPFFVLKQKLTILKNFGLSRRSGIWGLWLARSPSNFTDHEKWTVGFHPELEENLPVWKLNGVVDPKSKF